MKPLPRHLANTIESLDEKFQPEDFLEQNQRRSRQFTPRSLLLTMIQLAGSTNKEGYDHALTKVFGVEQAPRKGALAWYRNQISSKFFEKIFSKTIKAFNKHRPTYNGLILYAVGGWQFTLPREEDIVNSGFTGRKTSKHRESYMPKGFITHAYDVLSETTKTFAINHSPTELADALSFVGGLEQNSLTLYDRAYFSRTLCEAHFEAGNYFLARCKSNANGKVTDFLASDKEVSGMFFNTKKGKKKVWFLKITNPIGEVSVFATNLPRRWRNKKTVDDLYQLRWGAETSFYELSETVKIQQWHSKTYNGILQEIYTTLLVMNLTKILSFFARGQRHINPESRVYKKPNFKLLLSHFVQFVVGSRPQLANLIHQFRALIKRSTEKRKRRSRTYPRELRKPASPYNYNNTEWLWDKERALN